MAGGHRIFPSAWKGFARRFRPKLDKARRESQQLPERAKCRCRKTAVGWISARKHPQYACRLSIAQGLSGSRDPEGSKETEVAQPAFDRLRPLADQGGRSLPRAHRKAHQRSEARGEWIARVFDIELKTGLQKHGGAPGRPGVPMGKIQGGLPAPEYSAALSLSVPRDPKAMVIAADEKNRDRCVDDIRIRPQKRRGHKTFEFRQHVGRKRSRRQFCPCAGCSEFFLVGHCVHGRCRSRGDLPSTVRDCPFYPYVRNAYEFETPRRRVA